MAIRMNHNNKSASATAGTHTHTGRQGKRKRRTTSVKVARLFFGFSHGQLGDGTFRPAALSTHYDIIISPPSLSFWRSVYFFLVDKKLYLLCVVYIYLETPGGRKLRLYPHLFFFFFFFNKSTNFFSFFFCFVSFFFVFSVVSFYYLASFTCSPSSSSSSPGDRCARTHTCCPLMGGNEALLLDPLIGSRKQQWGQNEGEETTESRSPSQPQWHRLDLNIETFLLFFFLFFV